MNSPYIRDIFKKIKIILDKNNHFGGGTKMGFKINKIKVLQIAFLLAIGVKSTIFADNLEILSNNYFVTQTNYNPGKTTEPLLILSASLGSGFNFTGGINTEEEIETQTAAITSQALFYPSPFKFETGSTLGYRLNKDMPILIRIFDAQSNQILKRSIASGDTNGGVVGYNYVPFAPSDFKNADLPTGIYFFVIESSGDILTKGKFAVLP